MKIVKTLLVVLLGVMVFSGIKAQAAEQGAVSRALNGVSGLLSGAKVSTYWDIKNGRLLGGISTPIVTYKSLVSLDAGIISDLNNSSFSLGVSADVASLASRAGLTFNLPQKISVGVFGAKDFNNDAFLYGVSLNYKVAF